MSIGGALSYFKARLALCVKIPVVKSSLLLEEILLRYSALVDLRVSVERAVELICNCHRAGGKVLVCGNGGSAADAEHIVGELAKEFKLERSIPAEHAAQLATTDESLASQLQCGVAAISLVSQTSLATAIANDTDATMIFAQQVYVYGRPGDVVWGLSTSGNSRNVVRGFQVARAFGMRTIGFTGSGCGMMDQWCDVLLKAPENETYKIQELHLPLYHAICMMVEEELFG